MKFITKQEITNLIKQNILDDITQDNNLLLDEMEQLAMSEIDSYIGGKYDTRIIFSKTGNDRNQFIKALLIDIMLYHLHSRLTPSNIPDIRTLRYDKAISWLYETAKGKITPLLPQRELPFDNRSSESRFGYIEKINDYIY